MEFLNGHLEQTNSRNNLLNLQIENKTLEISQLSGKVEKLQNEILRLEEAKKLSESIVGQLQCEMEESAKRLSEQIRLSESNKIALYNAEKLVDELQAKKASIEKQNSQLKGEVDLKESQIKDLEEKVKRAEKANGDITTSIGDLQKQLEALVSNLSNLENEKSEITYKLAEKQKEIAKMKEEFDLLKQDRDSKVKR